MIGNTEAYSAVIVPMADVEECQYRHAECFMSCRARMEHLIAFIALGSLLESERGINKTYSSFSLKDAVGIAHGYTFNFKNKKEPVDLFCAY